MNFLLNEVGISLRKEEEVQEGVGNGPSAFVLLVKENVVVTTVNVVNYLVEVVGDENVEVAKKLGKKVTPDKVRLFNENESKKEDF